MLTNKNNFFEVFTTKKIIESKFFNFLGLQSFRYALAKFIYVLLGFFYKNKFLTKYYDNGFYLEENFFKEEIFKKINTEFQEAFEIHKVVRNVYEKSDNYNENSSIDYFLYEFEDNEFNKKNFPTLYSLLSDQKIKKYFMAAERKKNINIYMRLERIKTKDFCKNDVNSYWHVDTYHNTHKAWLYLSDVTNDHGPFNYLKKSSAFSVRRLLWEFLNSIKKYFNKSYRPFFVDEKNVQTFEKNKIEVICKKNSFLIANTHGYHRRGDAKPNMVRDRISFFTRENPFKIF